jgi:hypothetical protein
MTGRGGGAARKTLLAPIHFIFSLLQKRNTVSIWLYENLTTRIEGKIRVSNSYIVGAARRLTPHRDSTNS